jgi:3-oxoacyl-[acyl-carrier-protein] synthase-1
MQANNFIAASANIEALDAGAIGIPVITQIQTKVNLQRVMSNSFGFGGTNASLIFAKYNA